jgi:hypothetical protein
MARNKVSWYGLRYALILTIGFSPVSFRQEHARLPRSSALLTNADNRPR